MELQDLPERYQKQAAEKLKQTGMKTEPMKKKRSKYGNEKASCNGIRFDSKKEMRRYLELKGMYDAGIIKELKLQHHFSLQGAFKTVDGKCIERVEYIADFTYTNEKGEFVVEDVKSEITRKNPVYMMKKKLMAAKGYMIQEV